MPPRDGYPSISREELFARFAVEPARERPTVVTPNRRLALALVREFDATQLAAGRKSWEAPDVVGLSTWVERAWDDLLYSDCGARLPLLASPAQEQALWERALGAGSRLLSPSSTAALAADAWNIVHAWELAARLKDYPANDDARAFVEWSARYAEISEEKQFTDRARLPALVAQRLALLSLAKPRALIAYGFDIVTPQQRALFVAASAQGIEIASCSPPQRQARAVRVAFTAAIDEIQAAAAWARTRLEANPRARIGVVVPELNRWRSAIARVFTQALEPARLLPGEASRSLPVNVSLGAPLDSFPLAAAAASALDIVRGRVPFADASRLLRSPFIAGAQAEFAARALLEARLRERAGVDVGLDELRRMIARDVGQTHPACPILAQRLALLAEFAASHAGGTRLPSRWVPRLLDALERIGFPGERTLDSAEHQTFARLREALAELARLDRVCGRVSYPEIVERLRGLLRTTLFQPETPTAPVEVLGVLESAGLAFDHLWVMGLTDEIWPMPVRPNPLIPVALQRAAGVPQAAAETSLELDRRITRGWLAAAQEVVLSYPQREDDRELSPSPLLREVAQVTPAELGVRPLETLKAVIHRARREERVEDARAPAIAPAEAVAGGTAVFRDQAACPFKAFAIHRLGAEPLDSPAPGLTASERGALVHGMLARVWAALKSSADLARFSERDLEALFASAAEEALRQLLWRRPQSLALRFAAIEKERLMKLARDWLHKERERPWFEVLAIEQKRSASFGGVTINARLDRVDRLAGGCAVLDYKTGAAKPADWMGQRPDEPQLPIYALSGGGEVAAVAFARVKAGEMEFIGVARERGLLPGVDAAPDWDALLAEWRRALDALGSEFARGEARVDPKRGDQTCRRCDLHALCRISERSGAAEEEQ